MKLLAYCRVSAQAQRDNTSLQGQLSAITSFVAAAGHSLEEEPILEVESGAKLSRAGLLRALRLLICSKCAPPPFAKNIPTKQIFEILDQPCGCTEPPTGYDGIIAFDLDRVGRDAQILLWLGFDFLQRRNKHLIVLNGLGQCDTTTPHGRFMFGQFALVAQFYRENLIERTKKGRQDKAKKSGYLGGCPPYGLRRVGDSLEVDEKQQAVLEEIARLKREGFTYRTIADILNTRGIKSRQGKRWTHNMVWNALRAKKLRMWVAQGKNYNYLEREVDNLEWLAYAKKKYTRSLKA